MTKDLSREVRKLLDHGFTDEKGTEYPITIVGPSASPSTKMRVYAYGGCIGRMATEENNRDFNCLAKNNGEEDRYSTYLEGAEKERLAKMLRLGCGKEADGLLFNPEYLNLILKAAKLRFTKKNGKPDERRLQTAIVKMHMSKEQRDGWCIVDMEYAISGNEKSDISKPDIVVLDKDKGFGLIEFKYDNENMGNLSKHYEDSRRAAIDYERHVEELKRRCGYLIESGLIDQELYGASAKDRPLWYGFLFVGGKKTISVDAAKKAAEECPDLADDENCRFWWYPEEGLARMDLCFDAGQTYRGFTTV